MFSRLLQVAAASAALASIASAQDGILVGRVEGENYVSATGEFKVPVPVLTELGGKITDTENVVTFSDNYNIHLSIACFPLDATQRWEFETRGPRDYLLYFFTTFVLVDFQSRFPGSSIESARFVPSLMGGTMLTFALLPSGSYFERANSITGTPPEHPVIAKRGTLLFVRNRFVYILSSELAERATQRSTYDKTTEQEDQLLSDRLIALAGRLVFTGAKPRTP